MEEANGRPEPPTAPIRTRKRRTKKTRTRKHRHVTCLVCGGEFRSLTPEHLLTHSLTVQRYSRVFLAGASPAASAAKMDPAGSTLSARQLATRLASDQGFVVQLADEVAEAIFSGPLRDRLRLGLVSLLSSRMTMHADAVALLSRIRKELSAPWRLEQGGALGAPTETKELVQMAMQMHAEVVKGEDALLRTIKLAIDEKKGSTDRDNARGGLQPYTGEAEIIPVPPDLSPGERETVRSLLTLITSTARAGTPPMVTIDDIVLPAPAPAEAPASEPDDVPVDALHIYADDPPPAPTPVIRADESVGPIDPFSME